VTDEHTALLGKMLALAPKLALEHGMAVTTAADGKRGGGYKTLINSGRTAGRKSITCTCTCTAVRAHGAAWVPETFSRHHWRLHGLYWAQYASMIAGACAY
jgi:hypothetical protein